MQLRLGQVATRLDSLPSYAATARSSYLDFLDALHAEETEAKQRYLTTNKPVTQLGGLLSYEMTACYTTVTRC